MSLCVSEIFSHINILAPHKSGTSNPLFIKKVPDKDLFSGNDTSILPKIKNDRLATRTRLSKDYHVF